MIYRFHLKILEKSVCFSTVIDDCVFICSIYRWSWPNPSLLDFHQENVHIDYIESFNLLICSLLAIFCFLFLLRSRRKVYPIFKNQLLVAISKRKVLETYFSIDLASGLKNFLYVYVEVAITTKFDIQVDLVKIQVMFENRLCRSHRERP